MLLDLGQRNTLAAARVVNAGPIAGQRQCAEHASQGSLVGWEVPILDEVVREARKHQGHLASFARMRWPGAKAKGQGIGSSRWIKTSSDETLRS